MDKATQKLHESASPWRWVLFALAVALTVTWLFLTPEGLLGKADAVGYAVCHRIDGRSFHIGDRPVPLCARCSGMFLGALLGLAFQIVQGRKGKMPPVRASMIFGLLAFLWVLDGTNSFLMLVRGWPSLYQTTNVTRLVTGTGMGLAVSAFLLPSFIQTMFTKWRNASPFGSWKQVLGVLLAAVVLDGLLLLESPWILYPLSLLSAVGVLVLLIMVYSMVLVMIVNKENTYDQFRQFSMPITGGFIVALVQIGVMDLLRFLWTGTWEGFNLLSLSAIIKLQEEVKIIQWIF